MSIEVASLDEVEVVSKKNTLSLILSNIEDIYLELLPSVKSKRELHTQLQQQICDLSSRYELKGESEVCAPLYRRSTDMSTRGHLDVMWFLDTIPLIAFEIDSSYRQKSIDKLSKSQALFKIWIYYGNRNLRNTHRVQVLRLPSPHFERNRRRIRRIRTHC